MATHYLKTVQPWFAAVDEGRKTAEIRHEMDRTFDEGDVLVMQEWSPERGYSGASVTARITHVMRSDQFKGLAPGHALLSFLKIGVDL